MPLLRISFNLLIDFSLKILLEVIGTLYILEVLYILYLIDFRDFKFISLFLDVTLFFTILFFLKLLKIE